MRAAKSRFAGELTIGCRAAAATHPVSRWPKPTLAQRSAFAPDRTSRQRRGDRDRRSACTRRPSRRARDIARETRAEGEYIRQLGLAGRHTREADERRQRHLRRAVALVVVTVRLHHRLLVRLRDTLQHLATSEFLRARDLDVRVLCTHNRGG